MKASRAQGRALGSHVASMGLPGGHGDMVTMARRVGELLAYARGWLRRGRGYARECVCT
jgi:hypothetical protein